MVRFTPLIIALAAGSATACTTAPKIFTKTILGLPAGSFKSPELNFKNPNCQDLGYSYGYKFDGCVNKSSSSSLASGGVFTQGNTCPSTLAADVVCDQNGIDATVTPNQNIVLIMKGGTVGGTVYKLEAGKSVKLDVGARQGISHMEFCFICDECGAPGPVSMPAPAQPAPAPAQPAPAPAPADEPKGKPADSGKPAEPAPAPAEPVPAPADEPKGKPADSGKPAEPAPAPAEPVPAPADEPKGKPADSGKPAEPAPAPADEPKGKPADELAPAPPSEPTVCADAESMAVAPPKSLYEIAKMGEEYFPKCGDIGQNEAFQGQHLETSRGCVRVNICHGNAGFGWNRITVDRSAIGVDNNGQGGHAKFEHNDPTKNKRPDFFPGTYSVPNPNGAGKNGYLDSMCNFVPGCPTDGSTPEPVVKGEDEPPTEKELPPPPKEEVLPPPTFDADPEGDAADEKAFTRGDPHFKTFGGELYDYHGQCDLVLLDNPKFKNGLGMTAHIRTKIQDFWSSVESAALKIGDDFLEISGGGGKEWLWVNGVANEELEEEKWYRTSLSGFLVRFKQTGSVREANIYLEGSKEVLVMKTYHAFVRVDFKWQESENYEGSVGLLGARDLNGARVGRDGVTEISDVNAFGQEWQVKEDEDKLFHNYDDTVVQAPAKCVLPPSMTDEKIALRKRRLAESDLTVEKAEKACEHVHGAAERKACAYDILATQDINMAGAW